MANGQQALKGWFKIDGKQPGDRTLEQQMRGLDPLLAEVQGKSVLDVGCAEGLISIEIAKLGASAVRGIEIVERYIPVARELAKGLPCKFLAADADDFAPIKQYDIVIALALLHKLRNPSKACMKYADACLDLMVIRLPPGKGMLVLDERSNMQPHDIGKCMEAAGFDFEQMTLGPFDEPTFYFRRRR